MPPPDSDTTSAARRTALEAVLLGGAFVLFLAMLYEMYEAPNRGAVLTPLLLAGAGVILVWPMRRQRPVRGLLLAGSLIVLLWLLEQLATILLPFAIVFVLAYLFAPAVAWLNQRYRVPRGVSSLGFVLLVLGGLALLFVLLVPTLLGQIQTLGMRLFGMIGDLRDWALASPLLDRIEQIGLADKDEVVTQVTTGLQDAVSRLSASLPEIVSRVASSISTILGMVTLTAAMPAVLFYLLKDYPHIMRRVAELFPTIGGQRNYLVRAGYIVGNYLRGQLIISSIVAFNVGLLLTIFGFPFSILMGVIAGMFNMIPHIGAIITMSLGVVIAFIFGDPLLKDLLVVVGVLLGQGLLEQTILSPKILSSHVGLHPVLIILSLFVFGYFMGIFGLFIAVPVTALLMTFYKSYRDQMTLELTFDGGAVRAHERVTKREG